MSVASVGGRACTHRQTSGACKPEKARARRGAGAETEQAPPTCPVRAALPRALCSLVEGGPGLH